MAVNGGLPGFESYDAASVGKDDYYNYDSAPVGDDDYMAYGGGGFGGVFDPKKSDVIFKFTLTHTNGTGNTSVVTLAGPGYQAKGVLNQQGDIEPKSGSDPVTVNGKRGGIGEFHDLIRDNPGLIPMTRLETPDETQFEEIFTLRERSFSKNEEEEFIDPQDYISPNQFHRTICEIERPYILGPDNFLDIPVIPGNTLTVTLYFTALENRSAGFKKKIERHINTRY